MAAIRLVSDSYRNFEVTIFLRPRAPVGWLWDVEVADVGHWGSDREPIPDYRWALREAKSIAKQRIDLFIGDGPVPRPDAERDHATASTSFYGRLISAMGAAFPSLSDWFRTAKHR